MKNCARQKRSEDLVAGEGAMVGLEADDDDAADV